MSIKKQQKVFILCLLSPLLGIIQIGLQKINTKKDKKIVFLFGVIAFILGYNFIPPKHDWDISRHYEGYSVFIKTGRHIYDSNRDMYLKILKIIGKQMKIANPNFIGGTSAFILYYYLMKTFLIIEEKLELKPKEFKITLLCYLLIYPFILFSGIRYCVGLAFFIYGITLYFYTGFKNKSYLYMILGIFAHFAIIVPFLIFIISSIIKRKISIKALKYISIIALILGRKQFMSFLIFKIVYLFNVLGIDKFFKISEYGLGSWGINFTQEIIGTGIGILFQALFPKIIILFYIFAIKENNNFELRKYLILLSMTILFLFELFSFRGRMFLVILPLILGNILVSNIFTERKSNSIIFYIILLYGTFIQILDLKMYGLYYNYLYILKMSVLNFIL